MAIKHIYHDHPLEFRSVRSDAGAHCFICQQPVSGYNYKCSKCNLFSHISCLKLPLESVHPLHQEHPLTLLNQPPPDADNRKVLCNKCSGPSTAFTYRCAACSFSLHLLCSIEENTYSYEVHKHPLTFSASPPNSFASFRCKMCGELGFGFCLLCRGCQFFVHVECSTYSATVRYPRHEHIFNLITVETIEDGTGEFYCTVCEERVNEKGSIYYCADCEYIGHLGCVAFSRKTHVKFAYRDVDLSSSDFLDDQNHEKDQKASNDQYELLDDEELAKMRRRFSELKIGNGEKLVDTTDSSTKHTVLEIKHFSHEHQLRLTDDHQKDEIVCYACWGQISGQAYGCSQCRFFLHIWCAELPQSIKHPIHPEHILTLLSSDSSYSSQCSACDLPCDGFIYKCKSCYFNLHAMCASIPTPLRNEIHQHPLILSLKRPYSTRCDSCKEDCVSIVFQCEMCNLVLDYKCALLPHTVRHRCHIDPLTLTSLVEDEDEYYCHACEELREPNHWVYYCAECEFTAHKNCVVSELVGGIPKEGPLQFNTHEHLLDLITKVPSNTA